MARHSVIDDTSPLGVVIVGAGFIADHHGAALRASSRARLAGVVDVDAGRASAAATAAGGVPWTTDLAEALARPDVGAAIVCTPNLTHEPIALQVAAAGRHLLMEKPLTVTVPSPAPSSRPSTPRGRSSWPRTPTGSTTTPGR